MTEKLSNLEELKEKKPDKNIKVLFGKEVKREKGGRRRKEEEREKKGRSRCMEVRGS